MHTATLSRNLPAEQLCQPRVVGDARSDGRVVLGMETLGILRFYFKEMGQLAAMLNKEAILAQILPYLQREAQTEEWNVPIHTGRSFAKADNNLLRPIYNPVQRAMKLTEWINAGMENNVGKISQVKQSLRELREGGTLSTIELVICSF